MCVRARARYPHGTVSTRSDPTLVSLSIFPRGEDEYFFSVRFRRVFYALTNIIAAAIDLQYARGLRAAASHNFSSENNDKKKTSFTGEMLGFKNY